MDTPRRTSAELTVRLDRASPRDTDRIGVKAANLASLVQAGFDVPPGAVLTTDGYLYAGPNRETEPLPAQMREALDSIVSELGGGPLAVRSSSVGEDLADASFAGQYERCSVWRTRPRWRRPSAGAGHRQRLPR